MLNTIVLKYDISTEDQVKLDSYATKITKLLAICNNTFCAYCYTADGDIDRATLEKLIIKYIDDPIMTYWMQTCVLQFIDEVMRIKDRDYLKVLQVVEALSKVRWEEIDITELLDEALQLSIGGDVIRLVFKDLPNGEIKSVEMLERSSLVSIVYETQDVDHATYKQFNTPNSHELINRCKRILNMI